MNENRSISYHYWIRTLILLGFSSYIVYLSKTDALQLYLAPRMMPFVKGAAVCLYVVACFQGYAALRAYWGKRVACDCEHPVPRSALRSITAYGLLILPLLVGFMLPDTALGSALAAKKGMNLAASQTALSRNAAGTPSASPPAGETPRADGGTASARSDALAAAGNAAQTGASTAGAVPSPVPSAPAGTASGPAPAPDTANMQSAPGAALNSAAASAAGTQSGISDAELQKLFHTDDEWNEDFSKVGMYLYKQDKIVVKPSIYMEILSSIDLFKENFIGKTIEISGFVYREDDLKDNQFIVGRFAVSCCSADASPYGVLVDFPTAKTYSKDAWVKVTGTIQKSTYRDNEIFTIKASKVEIIKAPESPYVYPNFEPLKELGP